jgi:hypothetical protein
MKKEKVLVTLRFCYCVLWLSPSTTITILLGIKVCCCLEELGYERDIAISHILFKLRAR